MTDKYNQALNEQLRSNIWTRTEEAVQTMSPLDKADLITSVSGIFDPTPASDLAGLGISLFQGDWLGAGLSVVSMVPYAGDAIAKPAKIAAKAPKVAEAIEAALKAGDKMAGASKAVLQKAGLSLEQVADARKQALAAVQKAMLDARQKFPNCEACQLVGSQGERRTLQMPTNNANGTWVGGKAPRDGNGTYAFPSSKALPDGREVSSIEYRNGAPNFDDYVEGGKHELWNVSGDVTTDAAELKRQMRQTDPGWLPPPKDDYVLHHFEDGAVGYVPRVLHDKVDGGVAHTGGNSMLNNDLF